MLGGDNGILSVVALVEGFEHGGIEGELYLLCRWWLSVPLRTLMLAFDFSPTFAYYYFRSR